MSCICAKCFFAGAQYHLQCGNSSRYQYNTVFYKPNEYGGTVPNQQYGQVTTFAGSTAGVYGTAGLVNGVGTAARFDDPQDMAFDAAGNLFVTDEFNNVIRKITPTGLVSTFAGSMKGDTGYIDGKDTSARFNAPDGLTFDASGNLFVADYNNTAIRKITPDGTVSTFYKFNLSPLDPFLYPTEYFDPTGMCFDKSGNLIVALYQANQIVKISPSGVETVITGVNPYLPPYIGSYADITNPSDVKIDTSGNLFVASSGVGKIAKIAVDGTISVVAGNFGTGVIYGNGTGATVGFNEPLGLQVMPDGIIYVADTYNNVIQKVLPNGTTTLLSGVPVIFQQGAQGYADGSLLTAQYNLPEYVRANKQGDLYVSEWADLGTPGGNRIRKLTLTGYQFAGVLPAGLTFDATTGTISGTVTEPFPTQTDTVKAYNATGVSTALITLSYQPLSTTATLGNLVPASGTLRPAFTSGTTNYADSVSNSIASITLTPTASDTTATVTVNGTAVTSGTASMSIPLVVGNNTITKVVTAQNGTTKDTYSVIVTRAASSVATLTNLIVNQGTLSPSFNSGTTAYADSVSNSTANITVMPSITDSTATVTVNGTAVTSGTASAPVPLTIGPNTITTVVTAQDGTTKDTYTLTVDRAALSTVATLNSLAISQGTLTPSFAMATINYTAAVPNTTTSLTATPVTTDAYATIQVNGTAVADGTASAPIPLAVGPNIITTVVTAQDGITLHSYTVIITRSASSNAALSNLTVSQGTLSPLFSTGTTAYTDSVATTVASVTVTPTSSDNNATITVNGTVVASGTASNDIPLSDGINTITVVITAQDGTTMDNYSLTIYRGAVMASLNANNILTPNGDGKNDLWLVKDIALYPNNTVNIFDSSGKSVYSKNGYNNEWDGTINGRPLAKGTYYYIVDLGPNLRKFKGYISILRKY